MKYLRIKIPKVITFKIPQDFWFVIKSHEFN